ncbi:hypothetical protein ASAC_0496 [Acidilobus saccharovorans 345-15]|uniref:Uncharacterized protein n=1 Tax=Acidilobus saccharovorans (strain DSM 16705 / JCM 18335 / VKM B-2471 / 345-15) TaxID=666510 RepID=D9Q0R5_ACIS3|nr:DUF1641 domain-containing protein [Acidilobus saccharovorans]ADL18903.1 hypothetical protein ASAC_0496 [Acidilobus saccharovorans 345-15]
MSEDNIKAAQLLGAALGAFVSSLLTALPASLEEIARQGGQSEGPSSQIARWAVSTSQEISRVLDSKLPPQEVGKLVEELVVSFKGLASVAIELSKTLGDPQVAEVIRRTSEGFKKSLNLISPSYYDPMAMVRAMSDPDVAYALGVILAILKAFGVALRVSADKAVGGSKI